MRRFIVVAIGLAALGLAAGAYALYTTWGAGRPILVGLLHSRSGTLAAAEQPLIDAELLALDEINAAGGLLGRKVQAVVVDGRSSPQAFAEQARRLIGQERVSVIFGGLTSACRKAIKPVVEESQHLLVYPAMYEGLETSSHIVYAAGPANQLATPAVTWCREALGARTVFLLGTDALSSRGQLALAQDAVKAHGMTPVGEAYVPPDGRDLAGVVAQIRKAAPDVVISTLEGESNGPFYERLQQEGLTPERLAVLSLTVNEEDLRVLPPRAMTGRYSAANYLQSINRPQNRDFVRRYKARYGQDHVTSDEVTSAYNGVRFWAQAVAEAKTDEVAAVLRAIRRQSLDAPEGIIAIDYENLNAWRAFFLGKARPDGQFDIIYSLPKPIPPNPFPRTRTRAEWEALLGEWNSRWGGQWAAPADAPARRSAP
jgi:urea transport system substrate-binding protein